MSKIRLPRPLFLVAFVCALLIAGAAKLYLSMPMKESSTPPSAPAAKPKVEDINDILNTGTKRYSQFNEELVIRDFFRDRQGGVFVDAGCASCMRNNTTYYLEKHLNWSGIAIDAQESYRAEWQANRPKSKFFAYALASNSGEKVKFFFAPEVRDVSSLSQAEVDRWKTKSEETEVETITLNKLLDDNGITKIDFLSMDIEGAEPDALKGFDIDRFQPALVCIEGQLDHRQILTDYFVAHNYELIERYAKYDEFNMYFTPSKKQS